MTVQIKHNNRKYFNHLKSCDICTNYIHLISHYNLQLWGHCGNSIVSLMFGIPRINCKNLSKSIPKPADGTVPHFQSSKYHPNTLYRPDLFNLSWRSEKLSSRRLPPLEEPADQLLKPRKGACVHSIRFLDLPLYLHWLQTALQLISNHYALGRRLRPTSVLTGRSYITPVSEMLWFFVLEVF